MTVPLNFVRYGFNGPVGYAQVFRKNHAGAIFSETFRQEYDPLIINEVETAIGDLIENLDQKFNTESFPN